MNTQQILDDDDDSAESEGFSRYQVSSRREIISILRTLANQNQLITLQANNTSEPVMTSVLGVDEDSDTVFIDCSRSSTVNQRLAESRKISFTTALDNIRIHFSTEETMERCKYDNQDAFSMPLPESLIRLQRREYFRVPTPITNPVKCAVKLTDAEGKVTQTLSLPLQNVSGGGIALIDENKLLDNTVGKIYRDCRIDLPGGSPVIATLEIRNSHEIKLNNGKLIRRVGCLFIDLPMSMVSAVQRYITKLERERAAKSKGLN
jgi:c-di-GMP-binding flagellar brake protein YcgR